MKGLILALVVVASLFGSSVAVAARTLVPGDTCLMKGSLHTVGTGALECGPKLRWRVVAEGRPCLKVAARTSTLSCINRREGRRWQKPFTYQEQACDPSDPRITVAGVLLPREGLTEARIAAACVALEWLANTNVEYPKLQVLSEWQLPETALADAASRARGALRLYWKYRGIDNIKPTYMVFTSPAEFCALATKYFTHGLLSSWKVRGFSTAPDDMPWTPDCNDTKPFSGEYCESGPYAAVWPGGALDRKSGGAFGHMCREDLESWSGLNFHKFWQGVQSPIALSLGSKVSFSYALLNADYLFSDYAGLLTEGELSGSLADLCSPASRYYTCKHDQMMGRLTTYKSSSTWWKAGATMNGSLSAEYLWARQTAMEWFVAHFGLDAAYLLPVALVGVSTKSEYLAVLDSYTDWGHKKIFSGIDAWVAPQFGLTAP